MKAISRWRSAPLYVLGMFVVHDGEEFIDRQHLGQRLGVEQFLGSLQGDGVGQGPVRVVGHHQVANVLHRLLLGGIHLLPAEVSAATVEGGKEGKKWVKRREAERKKRTSVPCVLHVYPENNGDRSASIKTSWFLSSQRSFRNGFHCVSNCVDVLSAS